jgi:membrane-anchored protein YejM (alkaline phosphatase superfamily)
MFPLSYPATAKTLMSRYSLLDIEDYQQRKSLQFNQSINGIRYPAEPVYCAVNASKKALILVTVDNPIAAGIDGLNAYNQHYTLASSVNSAAVTLLYGMPELYHSALYDYSPLLTQLPQSMGLKVSLYSHKPDLTSPLSEFSDDFSAFKQQLLNHSSNLAIGFVTAAQAIDILTPNLLQEYKIVITSLNLESYKNSPLFSNFTIKKSMSSLEDIAPTALELLSCNANPKTYSTGSSLTQKDTKSYVVSTQGNKVLLLTGNQRIEIMNNGNVRVFDLTTGEETFNQVDPNILSQGIKHLSHFSAKRSIKPI